MGLFFGFNILLCGYAAWEYRIVTKTVDDPAKHNAAKEEFKCGFLLMTILLPIWNGGTQGTFLASLFTDINNPWILWTFIIGNFCVQ